MEWKHHSWSRLVLPALALGLAVLPRPVRAQPGVTAQGFKVADYYPAPHETQMKWLIEGANAAPQPDGRTLVTGVKYQTFREAGGGELIVQAPQCYFDRGQRTISSPGPLRVQTADGAFSIEGEGFLYEQTNSFLRVSNRVHTIIYPEMFGPKPAMARTNAPPPAASVVAEPGMDIFSDQFEYAETAGRGIYQGNVRVVGTNLTSSAEQMTVLISVAERRSQTLTATQNVSRLISLTATQNVKVDYVTAEHEQIQATGERAVYSADKDVVEMSGKPTWRAGQRDGNGDELVFDRTNNIFRAIGHSRLRMPAQNMGSSGLFAHTNSAAVKAGTLTNQFVEVTCDNYELRTNLAFFRKQVRVCDRLGDELRGQMTCGQLALTFAGTNELQKMVAEQQVLIEQEDRKFTADKADYTGTNTVLELTGDPRWQAGPREGKGDQIRVNLAHDEMLVRGNAYMKLPAAELGQSAISAMGKPKAGTTNVVTTGTTNVVTKGTSKVATNEFAEVFCEEYFLTPDSGLFQGHVRIEHPQMNWVSGEITMLALPELGKAGRMIIAEPNVICDLTDDKGQAFHLTGRKAVFTHRVTTTLTNDLMELTGTPAMLVATNMVGRNDIIKFDLARHTVTAPGRYKLWGAAPEVATTILRPSKSKPAK
jgi:lipopolysaccharide export system protein LptA